MRSLFIFVFTLVNICATAQKIPTLFPDGREWHCVRTGDKLFFGPDRYYKIIVAGDTIVEDKSCRKLNVIFDDSNNENFRTTLVAYEEKGKVYGCDMGVDGKKFILMMDFNMHKGDTYSYKDPIDQIFDYNVTGEDTVEVDGIKHRRLTINNEYHWVEGIGSDCQMAWMFPSETYWGIYDYMDACYDNGVKTFSKDDFTKISTNIKSVGVGENVSGKIYDLNGITVRNVKKGTIVIRNGKKYIAR